LTGERVERRLAAILAADVEGYSRLMGADEVGTLRDLTQRRSILDGLIASHRGRIANTAGDSVLAEFGSAVDAVQCAAEAQVALAEANSGLSPDHQINFRIGVHVGDVMIKGGDLFGDGVNIAARLQTLASAGGTCISGAAHDQVRKILPFAFTDLGAQQVKNIEEPVRAFAVSAKGASVIAGKSMISADQRPLALPDKPSIAVLPFQNMSGDPEQEYFADGMVEDIITALSKFKSLFVIARNSSFTYKGKPVDIKQAGRELGVRYVLEGSVRKAGGRVRITGQLIDCETGTHLWADRFEGSLEDVFNLQDEVTGSVVGAIAPKVERAEIDRARRKPVENLNAYDCFLRGLAHTRVVTRESYDEALRLFYRAIELDPDFSTPYGLAARCYNIRMLQGWRTERDREEAETRRMASRVSAIGLDDALALCWSGFALFRLCREYDAGIALLDRGLSINQNLSDGWHTRGIASMILGQHEAAIEQSDRAIRLDPLDPEIYRPESIMALSHLLLGRYDEALTFATRALARQPKWMTALRALAAVHALTGNLAEARKIVIRIRQEDPKISMSGLQSIWGYQRPQDVALLNEGLRLAGLPE
jgi:TolB-like protein/class 3 adenylate cyclase/tetratricopeptide (TPR) repeat protein